MHKIDVGTVVKLVRNRAWRPGETGTVVALLPSGRFTVQFDKPGIGYDGGLCLDLDDNEVEVVL